MARRGKPEIGPPGPKPPPICPLCERLIPPHGRSSRHHLTPRLKGGAKLGTVLLHQICHGALHARFSETELARRYNSVEALKAAPELAEFLSWVRTKPGDFHAPTKVTRSRAAADQARRLR